MKDQKLYHDLLLDYYKHPRNRGALENAHFTVTIHNPLCGDQVTMQGIVKDGFLTSCMFEGKGCVISLAAASMLTEKAFGKTVQELQAFDKKTMLDLVKLELGPTRLRCALLALEALQKGLNDAPPGKAA